MRERIARSAADVRSKAVGFDARSGVLERLAVTVEQPRTGYRNGWILERAHERCEPARRDDAVLVEEHEHIGRLGTRERRFDRAIDGARKTEVPCEPQKLDTAAGRARHFGGNVGARVATRVVDDENVEAGCVRSRQGRKQRVEASLENALAGANGIVNGNDDRYARRRGSRQCIRTATVRAGLRHATIASRERTPPACATPDAKPGLSRFPVERPPATSDAKPGLFSFFERRAPAAT